MMPPLMRDDDNSRRVENDATLRHTPPSYGYVAVIFDVATTLRRYADVFRHYRRRC